MITPSPDNPPDEGLRARKRRETLRRITDAGIGLFIEKGYDATTLDEIAAKAGISRRTFFYYFQSKDDILLSLQSGMGEMLSAAVRDASRDATPLEAVRSAMVAVCATIPTDDMRVIDGLMRSSKAVQARKQASYVEQEQALLAAMRERWPDPARETALALIAMLAVGAMRLSLDAFHREDGKRPLTALLTSRFDALQAEMGSGE